jgi:hypothetical protein
MGKNTSRDKINDWQRARNTGCDLRRRRTPTGELLMRQDRSGRGQTPWRQEWMSGP